MRKRKGKLPSQPILNPKGQFEIASASVSNTSNKEAKSAMVLSLGLEK